VKVGDLGISLHIFDEEKDYTLVSYTALYIDLKAKAKHGNGGTFKKRELKEIDINAIRITFERTIRSLEKEINKSIEQEKQKGLKDITKEEMYFYQIYSDIE
jgi:hypothetical protein